MSSVHESTALNLALHSSFLGITRGLAIQTFVYPLDVVKFHQQRYFDSGKSYQVARQLFQKDGVQAFYKGLSPQLLKTSIKQTWCWPLMTGLPIFLQGYGVNATTQQALTAAAIATVDAAITTPLERAKILAALADGKKRSFRQLFTHGWQGFTTHWSKLAVNWSVFLIAQRYLRERQLKKSQRPALTLPELTSIGMQVAILASLAAAPFDVANTLKQAENCHLSDMFAKHILRRMYRGWPLSALATTIQSVASVILIDKLGQRNRKAPISF